MICDVITFMKLDEFDYNLPKELIAQTPANPRDSSRLLVLDKHSGRLNHHIFYDIVDYLKPGDILVMNDSKVFPARLIGQKEITGGNVEILLNHELEPGLWECLGRNLKIGNRIKFLDSKLSAVVIEKNNDVYIVRFNMIGNNLLNEIEKIGLIPLPPYIKRNQRNFNKESSDQESYQTVYAKERGSVAAPTAGLHFTNNLIKKIKEKGVKIEYVTLHVGLGTFAPVKSETIEKHKIHKEFYSVGYTVLTNIIKAKSEHRKVVAIGTTTTRALETLWDKSQIINNKSQTNSKNQILKSEKSNDYQLKINDCLSGWTDIFIYPGYKFKCVDTMITNFHLPKSSLLMLVSAFAGKEKIAFAYKKAIENNYRFYSYGDAMLIL